MIGSCVPNIKVFGHELRMNLSIRALKKLGEPLEDFT